MSTPEDAPALKALGEFGLIARMTEGLERAPGDLVGLGDDCAVLQVGDAVQLVTTDASVEGVHFDFRWCTPEDAGWRAMAGAISDIAAMGGVPRFATVSMALPKDLGVERIDALYAGLRGAATYAGVAIVGGDTTRSPGGIFIDITVLGEAPESRYLPRSGARAGDVLAVTGWPGRSAAALGAYLKAGCAVPLPNEIAQAHLRPVPRIAQGQWFARHGAVHAMIDVSDGLMQDAHHLVERSGVGLLLDTATAPKDAVLRQACAEHGLDLRRCYWAGGEDYELAVAVDAPAFEGIKRAFEAAFVMPLTRVGQFRTEGAGLELTGTLALDGGGFDHFRS